MFSISFCFEKLFLESDDQTVLGIFKNNFLFSKNLKTIFESQGQTDFLYP